MYFHFVYIYRPLQNWSAIKKHKMLAILFFIATVYAQTCPSGQVMIQSVCTDNDLTPLASFARFEVPGLKLYMKFSFEFPQVGTQANESFVTMMIETNNPYWFAFGFGNSMINADIWVFNIDDEKTTITPIDCFGLNYTRPSYDTDFQGQDDLILLGYSYNHSLSLVKFKRLVVTGNSSQNIKDDPHDAVLTQREQQAIIAYGIPFHYKLHFHQQNRQIVTFPFIEGEGSVVSVRRVYQVPHFYINAIVWGILVDIPIIFARYFKTQKWYLKAHGFLMTGVILISLVADGLMIYSDTQSYHKLYFDNSLLSLKIHLILGTSFVVLISVQLLGGWFLTYLIYEPKKIKNDLLFSKQGHAISGGLIYLIGKTNVLVGAILTRGDITTSGFFADMVIIIYLVTIAYRIYLEVLFRRNSEFWIKLLRLTPNQNEKKNLSLELNESKGLLNQMLENDQQFGTNQLFIKELSTLEQQFIGKKWVLFNNSVVELTDQVHPGGQFIWEQVQGREVSRFIYGAYPLECTQLPAYKHSEYAIKLLQKLSIGNIRTIPLFSEEQADFAVWTIASKIPLNGLTYMYDLKRAGITFTTTLTGIESFGRYFLLRSHKNPTISCRPYTMVLCMAQVNFEFRKFMISQCGDKLKHSDLVLSSIQQDHCAVSTDFPIIMKRYASKNGFSQYMDSLMIGDEVEMCGPFGTSFGINTMVPETVVIIAGGTGLLPFLDLMDFLLKKTIIGMVDEQLVKKLNPTDINFEKYFAQGFKIILILCVQSADDLIGSDIYLTLARLQSSLALQNFQMILSMGIQSQEYVGVKSVGKVTLNFEFFEKHINREEVQKVLICGPPKMNRAVPDELGRCGIEKTKIFLV